MDWMHIFQVNKRALDSGVTLEDIQEVVDNYDPAVHEAGMVLGHPKTDSPAYGWIEDLKVVGNTLLAKPKQVVEEFTEWIDKGHYKKISASFYAKGNPDNPTPGKLYLKHVGWLGANPPKIKGLPDYVFEESGGDIVTIEFSEVEFGDWGDNLNAQMWRSFREWLIETQSLELADRIIPAYQIESLIEISSHNYPNEEIFERLARLEDRIFSQPSFSESAMTEEELQQREAELATKEAELHRKQRTMEFSEALDGLIKEGKVLPVNKPSHLKQLQLLDSVPKESLVNFAEEGKEYDPVREYLDSLKNGPKQVEYSEVTGEDPPEPVDDPVAIAQGIAAEQLKAKEAGRTISFAEAAQNYKKNGGGN